MGAAFSRTEFMHPSESFRLCPGDARCVCGSSHRQSKWMYVERDSDGRELYRDPTDMMDFFLGSAGGGSGAWPVPWKDTRDWTVRDFERLGEVMSEYSAREKGRRGTQYSSPRPPHYTVDESVSSSGSSRRYPSWSEFQRMQASIDEKLRQMADEYNRNAAERDAFLFGTEADRNKERYQNNMRSMIQEMLPQLLQMYMHNTQQAGHGPGVNPATQTMGTSMPTTAYPVMMSDMMPMSPVAYMPSYPMAQAHMGIPSHAYSRTGNAYVRARKQYRPMAFQDDDAFDSDYGHFPRYHVRRGRYNRWRDDDDMSGRYGGPGPRNPRGPPGGAPRRPRPKAKPEGGLGARGRDNGACLRADHSRHQDISQAGPAPTVSSNTFPSTPGQTTVRPTTRAPPKKDSDLAARATTDNLGVSPPIPNTSIRGVSFAVGVNEIGSETPLMKSHEDETDREEADGGQCHGTQNNSRL